MKEIKSSGTKEATKHRNFHNAYNAKWGYANHGKQGSAHQHLESRFMRRAKKRLEARFTKKLNRKNK